MCFIHYPNNFLFSRLIYVRVLAISYKNFLLVQFMYVLRKSFSIYKYFKWNTHEPFRTNIFMYARIDENFFHRITKQKTSFLLKKAHPGITLIIHCDIMNFQMNAFMLYQFQNSLESDGKRFNGTLASFLMIIKELPIICN